MKNLKKLVSASVCLCILITSFVFVAPAATSYDIADGAVVFNSAGKVAMLDEPSNVSASYDSATDSARLLITPAASDPHIQLDLTGVTPALSANEYKYIVITYMVPASVSQAADSTEVFLCAGAVTAPTAGCSVSFAPVKNGTFQAATIDLSASAYWNGNINAVRIDVFSYASVGDVMYVDSVVFAKTASDAQQTASYRVSKANGLGTDYNYPILFNSADSMDLLTIANSGSLQLGDATGDGRLNMLDILALRRYFKDQTPVACEFAADADMNGVIELNDVLLIRSHLCGLSQLFSAPSQDVTAEYDPTAAARFTVANASGELSASVNYDGAVSASQYRYLVLTYMTPATEGVSDNSSLAAKSRIYPVTGSMTEPSADAYQEITLVNDGSYHAAVLNLSDLAYWSGAVDYLKFEVFTAAEAGDVMFVDSVVLCETQSVANSTAAARVAAKSGNVDTTDWANIIFDSDAKLSHFTAPNNTNVDYSQLENAAMLSSTINSGDPQVLIDYNQSGLSADAYKYIIITYKVPTTVSNTAAVTELFLSAGSILQPTGGCSVQYSLTKDGVYHSQIITLTDLTYWSGNIHSIRFDYFSAVSAGDIMYVDSVILATTRAEALSAAATRTAAANNGEIDDTFSERDFTFNSSTATAVYSGYTDALTNTYAMSNAQPLIITFKTPLTADFNRFTINYIASTYLHGNIYYKVNGAEVNDEFFLEAASSALDFTSLITTYFNKVSSTEITMIELYPLGSSTGTFRLNSITAEDYIQYDYDEYFLENSYYKVGVDMAMGGGVSYLEYYQDNNANYTNLLNNYDVGRLVQQSYYGIDHAPYSMGAWGDPVRPWGYNPVQGGDGKNYPSRVIDVVIEEGEIYVKCRPMDWGQTNRITPSYMENWYRLTDTYFEVDNRFIDFSGYNHAPATSGWNWQELPAFYTISELNVFSYYNGSSPWTGDSLTQRSDLVFWGAVSNQAFSLKSTSEFWCAWTDTSGMGVGVYVPGVYTYHAGKFGYDPNASMAYRCNPGSPATNYVAPRSYITLVSGKPLVYSYLIAAGSLSQIRSTFMTNRNIIDNSSLVNY